MSVIGSRVENRCSGFSLPVAVDEAFALSTEGSDSFAASAAASICSEPPPLRAWRYLRQVGGQMKFLGLWVEAHQTIHLGKFQNHRNHLIRSLLQHEHDDVRPGAVKGRRPRRSINIFVGKRVEVWITGGQLVVEGVHIDVLHGGNPLLLIELLVHVCRFLFGDGSLAVPNSKFSAHSRTFLTKWKDQREVTR